MVLLVSVMFGKLCYVILIHSTNRTAQQWVPLKATYSINSQYPCWNIL